MSVAYPPVDFDARSSTDELIESIAEASDPFAGDPACWARIWDADCWSPTGNDRHTDDAEELEEPDDDDTGEFDPIPEPPLDDPDDEFEPAEADRAWLNTLPLSIADACDDREATMATLAELDRRMAWEALYA